MFSLYKKGVVFVFLCLSFVSKAQLFQLNGAVFISMYGTSSASSYIILNNSSPGTGDLSRTTTTGRFVNINQDGFNQIQWNLGNTTGSYVFPIGTSTVDMPFTFNITGASGNSNTQITFGSYNTAASNNSPFPSNPTATNSGSVWGGTPTADVIDRFYNLWLTGTAPSGATLTFKYDGAAENTLAASATDNITAQRWVDATGWQLPQGTAQAAVTSGVGTFTLSITPSSHLNATTSTGAWILSRNTKPLPVELIEFAGGCLNGLMNVKWTTASETNNDFFNLERSVNGIDFESIATVQGAGTSTVYNNYKAIDLAPPQGIVYYRLKQTDFDGTVHYSNVITASCSLNILGQGSGVFLVYPNPSQMGSDIVIQNSGMLAGEVMSFELIDAIGQIVISDKLYADSDGNIKQAINHNKLVAAGVYSVVGRTDKATFKQTFVVNK